MLLTRIATVLMALTTAAASAQAPVVTQDNLRRRSALTNEALEALYRSPEYETAYQAAQQRYQNAQVQAWQPSPWHTYKQYQWLAATQNDLSSWTADVNALSLQLEKLAATLQVQTSPAKLAEIKQIQDDLSADIVRTLNTLVQTLPLKDLFNFNGLPDFENDWYPRKVPAKNTGVLATATDFAHRVNAALGATKGAHVHFKQTSKFPTYSDYLLDEKGNPITKPEPYYIFWQDGTMKDPGTVAPVQKTIVELHAHLARAQATIAAEALLDPPSNPK